MSRQLMQSQAKINVKERSSRKKNLLAYEPQCVFLKLFMEELLYWASHKLNSLGKECKVF